MLPAVAPTVSVVRTGMDDSVTRAALARRGSPYLNTAQAAHYLGVCARTLERMRKNGSGPEFSYHGNAARYHIDELIAWSKQHRGRRRGDPTQPLREPPGVRNDRAQ